MNRALKLGFINESQTIIQNRINRTDEICSKFDKCYDGSSSLVFQIFILSILGIVTFIFLGLVINLTPVFNLFPTENSGYSLFIRIALLAICGYFGLHIYKNILRITRTAKIDVHKNHVRAINKKLKKQLENINSHADEADKIFLQNSNQKIVSKEDLDTEINHYNNIVNNYSNANKDSLSLFLAIMHWLSLNVFSFVFLLVSTATVSVKIGSLFNTKEYALTSFIFILFFIFLHIFIQELYAKYTRNVYIKKYNFFAIAERNKDIKAIYGLILQIGIMLVFFYFAFGTDSIRRIVIRAASINVEYAKISSAFSVIFGLISISFGIISLIFRRGSEKMWFGISFLIAIVTVSFITSLVWISEVGVLSTGDFISLFLPVLLLIGIPIMPGIIMIYEIESSYSSLDSSEIKNIIIGSIVGGFAFVIFSSILASAGVSSSGFLMIFWLVGFGIAGGFLGSHLFFTKWWMVLIFLVISFFMMMLGMILSPIVFLCYGVISGALYMYIYNKG